MGKPFVHTRPHAHLSPLWTGGNYNYAAHTHSDGFMYEASELMKNSLSVAMAMKREIPTRSVPKHKNPGLYDFLCWCPRKRVSMYCLDGASAKQNNQTARDIMCFLLASIKNEQKKHDDIMNTHLHGARGFVAVGGESAPNRVPVHTLASLCASFAELF